MLHRSFSAHDPAWRWLCRLFSCPARGFFIFAVLSLPILGNAAPAVDMAKAEELLKQVTSAPVRPYATRDFGRARYGGGRSVVVAEADAPRLLSQLRQKLPAGLVAYVGVTRDLATNITGKAELAIAPGTSQFDILRTAATDGMNYGLKTDGIIQELQRWDEEFGIDIWQAETDTIQLRLKKLPKDMQAFAKRVYRFCPDTVEQGTGDVAALAVLIPKEKAVFLWWD
ncbi:MAG: DUF4253 domain-containing protein [Massilia sp.]